MVSASNDCGAIFADKTNLGNTTVTNSLDAETIVNDSTHLGNFALICSLRASFLPSSLLLIECC
ncbi:MAG: hypothetical protein WBP83_10045 [Nitrososphaeraceae archaeon]